MLKKKYLMLTSLVIVSILLGSLFYYNMVQAQEIPEYDPWIDINDDGIIDISDLYSTALAYGSTGNPTKNVTVTNFPLDEEGNMKVRIIHSTKSDHMEQTIEVNDAWSIEQLETKGYREITIQMYTDGRCHIYVHWHTHEGANFLQEEFYLDGSTTKTYGIRGWSITIMFDNDISREVVAVVNYYMTT